MRVVAATIGQTILLLVIGGALGLSVNACRGKDKISLSRNYFPPPKPMVMPTTAPVDVASGPETQPAPKSEFQELTLEDVIQLYDDPKAGTGEYVFVDARADEPYQNGHIPGAVQCDYYRSEQSLPGVLDRAYGADKVIVYCNGGDCEDSLLVCREFMNLAVPLEKIYLFRGGWQEWKQSGMPFEQK